jgi:hypothetical protein
MGFGVKEIWTMTTVMAALKKLPPNPPPLTVKECLTQTNGCYSLEISLRPETVEAILQQVPPDIKAKMFLVLPGLKTWRSNPTTAKTDQLTP